MRSGWSGDGELAVRSRSNRLPCLSYAVYLWRERKDWTASPVVVQRFVGRLDVNTTTGSLWCFRRCPSSLTLRFHFAVYLNRTWLSPPLTAVGSTDKEGNKLVSKFLEHLNKLVAKLRFSYKIVSFKKKIQLKMLEAKTASVNITLFYVNQRSLPNDVTAEITELHLCFVVHPQLLYLNILNFIFISMDISTRKK